MFDVATLVVLIPALPLAAAVLTAALGPRILRGRSHVPVIAAIGLACVASLLLMARVAKQSHSPEAAAGIGYERIVRLWTWAAVPQPDAPAAEPGSNSPSAGRDFRVEIVLRADPLSAAMLAMVTFISLLVAIYSIGYMQGDPGYWRFFSYIALFVFSMTMLVSASNFVLLYVFWEGVGLCSYLLIGFWFQKREAAAAGMKAFLVNRVGDFGFALGLFLIWTTYGSLDFHDTMVHGRLQPGVLGQSRLEAASTEPIAGGAATPTPSASHVPMGFVAGATGAAICLLLLLGACGKSAQFPLHVWLPDAMEGPTPVSALIHAATMVTAGIYMVVRCMPLFVAAPQALEVVAVIGGWTALMAAVIAVTQTDLKRILAYSTISQLGYMFLGLGAGTVLGATAGMFHLMTHAFFKALLFLGAGSVMHAMGGVIDVRRFSGLRRRMPWTHATFLIGCLALAGVVPFSGFWSKDAILAAVAEAGHGSGGRLFTALSWVALATALLTAFYTFRALFLAFYGPEKIPHEAGHHAHESPPTMLVPLVLLAVGAVAIGGYWELTHGLEHLLAGTPSLAYLARIQPPAETGFHWDIAGWSTLAAVGGIALAALCYLGRPVYLNSATAVAQSVGLYRLSYGKMFFDQLYNLVIVWPLEALALLAAWVDRQIVDGLVNLVGRLPGLFGGGLRGLQIGLVQFYALAMALAVLALLGAILM